MDAISDDPGWRLWTRRGSSDIQAAYKDAPAAGRIGDRAHSLMGFPSDSRGSRRSSTGGCDTGVPRRLVLSVACSQARLCLWLCTDVIFSMRDANSEVGSAPRRNPGPRTVRDWLRAAIATSTGANGRGNSWARNPAAISKLGTSGSILWPRRTASTCTAIAAPLTRSVCHGCCTQQLWTSACAWSVSIGFSCGCPERTPHAKRSCR